MNTEKAGTGIRAGIIGLALFASLPGFASAAAADPAASAPEDARLQEVLQRMRGVMRDVTTLRYDGSSKVQMPDGRRIAVSETKVVAERQVEASGWKVLVDGTFGFDWVDPKVARKDDPIAIRAAWDGQVASVLFEKRKILRKTAPADMEGVRLDMNQGDAAATVAWELLANPPYGNIDGAQKVEFEEPEKVDELECDVIWVVPASARGPAVPFRLAVAKKDGLPRRVEMFRPAAARAPKEKRGEPGIVLSYSNLIGTPAMSGETFDVELPKGFTLSASKNLPQQTAEPKEDPKPVETTPSADVPPQHPLLPSNPQLLSVGSNAPAFTLKDFEGKEHTLDEFKGKVIVMDFWGTWCLPCKIAMPAIQKVHEKFAGKDVVVIGMNFESNPSADPEKFKKDKGYTYMSLAHAETIAGNYRVSGWPTFYVIGKDGKVVWGSKALVPPPGGTNKQEDLVKYLEDNLTLAVEKALK
ncbi:MAG: TlpA family protein disulfide reductase [Phycisphaeraceae bacterium]|nr:TlpA family protein disulfide reductase [Phycisphaeraceae bacterium]